MTKCLTMHCNNNCSTNLLADLTAYNKLLSNWVSLITQHLNRSFTFQNRTINFKKLNQRINWTLNTGHYYNKIDDNVICLKKKNEKEKFHY